MIGTGARAFITAAIFPRPDSGFQDGESEKDRLTILDEYLYQVRSDFNYKSYSSKFCFF